MGVHAPIARCVVDSRRRLDCRPGRGGGRAGGVAEHVARRQDRQVAVRRGQSQGGQRGAGGREGSLLPRSGRCARRLLPGPGAHPGHRAAEQDAHAGIRVRAAPSRGCLTSSRGVACRQRHAARRLALRPGGQVGRTPEQGGRRGQGGAALNVPGQHRLLVGVSVVPAGGAGGS